MLKLKTKICCRCKKEYPATAEYFHRDKCNKDGLDYQCKECKKKQGEEYRKNNREKVLQYGRDYRNKNRTRLNKLANDRYYKHKEEDLKRFKKWRQDNTEKIKAYLHSMSGIYKTIKRAAKIKNLPVCSKQEFAEWYEKQDLECIYCSITENLLEKLKWGAKGKRNRLTIDRRDNDKGYTISNICLACWECNKVKNNLLSFQEMKEVGQKYIKPKWQRILKEK